MFFNGNRFLLIISTASSLIIQGKSSHFGFSFRVTCAVSYVWISIEKVELSGIALKYVSHIDNFKQTVFSASSVFK